MNDLEIEHLTVGYNGDVVLDNLDLTVRKGEFVAIVGKTGCGKTTLLNAIAGFLDYGGRIATSGTLGMVFQNYAAFPWLTVQDNILFGLKDGERVLEHYLEKTELTDKRHHYPFELSGGQKQRVSIARTLAVNPDIILMDEPYGALDIYTREKMQRWLLDLWNEEKKTILFVTHSIDEAVLLADRVLVLSDGVIQKEFEINLDRPRADEVRFDSRFVELKKEISEALR